MNGRLLAFAVAGIALLAGLYLAFQPQPPPPATPAAAPVPAAPIAAVPDPVARFDLLVAGRRLAHGEATLRVRQGQEVVLRVQSDEAEELHLHGYDLKLDLAAGTPATLEFKADRAGRFDFELEHSGTELGALEVLPADAP